MLVLSDFEDLPNKEIGEALGLTVLAVKARLHRVRLFLRGQLAVMFGIHPPKGGPQEHGGVRTNQLHV